MSPREAYNFDGTVMGKEKLQISDKKNYETLNALIYGINEETEENKRLVEMINEIIRNIDIKKLKTIFEQIGRRCGIDPANLNFLEPDKIHLITPNLKEPEKTIGEGSSYQISSNTILLNIKIINLMAQKLKGEEIKDEIQSESNFDATPLITLYAIIHEEIHATSYNRIQELDPKLIPPKFTPLNKITRTLLRLLTGRGAGFYENIKSGYSENKLAIDGFKMKFDNEFRHFDEGVTEKLTFEILRQYLLENHLDGLDGLNKEQIDKLLKIISKKSTYYDYIEFTELLVKYIADETDLNEQVVWDGIVRSKLEGINLKDPEIDEFTTRCMSNL